MSEKKEAVNPNASVTMEQVLELIKTLKEPSLMEKRQLAKEEAELAARQKERVENAQLILREVKIKHQDQMDCTHKRGNGQSRAVHNANPPFFICQKCQAVIFPGPEPAAEQRIPGAFYDTRMYTELLQSTRLTDF